VHAPWAAPAEDVAASGVRLGRDYPDPIIDHAAAREAFLAATKPGASRSGPESTSASIGLVPTEPDRSEPGAEGAQRGAADIPGAGAERGPASDGAGADDAADPIEPPAAAS
jgi:hypothetical protein